MVSWVAAFCFNLDRLYTRQVPGVGGRIGSGYVVKHLVKGAVAAAGIDLGPGDLVGLSLVGVWWVCIIACFIAFA